MASESRMVTVAPLNGSNYPTWKVQCRMALIKDGLWSIVNGSERPPDAAEADRYAKFVARRDRALAIVVLSIEPSLLYLIGDPEDPAIVWQKLADQFQKKTWANKLELRRKLYSLRLKGGSSVQEHIKSMTEIFDALSVIGDPVSEEDRVVHLLASLPESYSMLVTALEANAEVPKMEHVTERLLHKEQKLKDRGADDRSDKAMTAKHLHKKGPKCHHCGKFGHIRRNCRKYAAQANKSDSSETEKPKSVKHKANTAEARESDANSSDSEGESNSSSSDSGSIGLVARHALSTSAGRYKSWIVDSGATCHMCNNRRLFVELRNLEKPLEVTLGDGHDLNAIGCGVVVLESKLPSGRTRKLKLSGVLYVPKLSYNLLSVSKTSDAGKKIRFGEASCQVLDGNKKLIAVATRVGDLYYLNCCPGSQKAHLVVDETKEDIWHRRFGHLGTKNLQRLAKEKLVKGFNYDATQEINFCESCVKGKHHRSQFPTSGGKRSEEPLGLVHSDLCGKMSAESQSGAEYFLTFIDDRTRYVWVYILKQKDQVFERFLEWKALVEKSTGRKLKALRTDNGGEYTSAEFEAYLRKEGVRHELTVPKPPEQNGVAERMNRTLVETIRSMLADSKLPPRFWAEALSTAVYLRNRSPTKSVNGMTPFEVWVGEKPNVEHLRTFGCAAYAHIPKDERKKLDMKTRKCVLLGYGTETKGYRLYDPKRARVFYSRDVIFNEKEHGMEKEPETVQEGKRYVQIECPSIEEPVDEDTEPVQTTNEEPSVSGLRRSSRSRQPPDFYGIRVNVASEIFDEPTSINEALASPDKRKWTEAMEKEMESLHKNKVWDLVKLPKDRKAVGSKWVVKLKVGPDGSVERHKARLVAQGFSQKYGVDYDETFSPVVRFESLRTVIALAVQNGLKLHQMDVTTAFLNGELKEEVYMRQPEGFAAKGQEDLVCKLKRSIYGLKQSPRCWNSVLDSQLKQMGFVQAKGDPCIYVTSEGEMFIIAVYVDDIVLAGKSDKRMTEVKEQLAEHFQVKDMGELHYFLGVKIVQDKESGEVSIGQPAYTTTVLQKFGMEHAKPVNTPVDSSTKLMKATDEDECVDQKLYTSAVGSLLYLSSATRPDITYAVSNVAKYCAEPTKQHWLAVKRIMRYLKGTLNYGLLYSQDGSATCVGFSDADWGGDLDDRKSTSGYLFTLSGAAVSWRSKKQTCVALSTAEAEYIALASAAQEAIWLQQLTNDLKNESSDTTTIYEDNQSAICMSKHPKFHGRSKHIAIKYHFIREQVSNNTIELKYCRTNDMVADMLTKGLSAQQFAKLRHLAGVREMIEHSVCK